MKAKFGTLLMILGTLLILSSLVLFVHNRQQSAQAGDSARDVLPQLLQDMEQRMEEEAEEGYTLPELSYIPGTPAELMDPSAFEMAEVEIDGNSYIGYLSIPTLGLELPILSQWSYPGLKMAPARYAGTVKGENLVLLAHNYTAHFGKLNQLSLGDEVVFVDVEGNLYRYQVEALDVLAPNAKEEMTAGEYDLTMFTCTYDGRSRVTVFCDLIKD